MRRLMRRLGWVPLDYYLTAHAGCLKSKHELETLRNQVVVLGQRAEKVVGTGWRSTDATEVGLAAINGFIDHPPSMVHTDDVVWRALLNEEVEAARKAGIRKGRALARQQARK